MRYGKLMGILALFVVAICGRSASAQAMCDVYVIDHVIEDGDCDHVWRTYMAAECIEPVMIAYLEEQQTGNITVNTCPGFDPNGTVYAWSKFWNCQHLQWEWFRQPNLVGQIECERVEFCCYDPPNPGDFELFLTNDKDQYPCQGCPGPGSRVAMPDNTSPEVMRALAEAYPAV